jgi:hypothetical protein
VDLLEDQQPPLQEVVPAQVAVITLMPTEDAKHVTHNKLFLVKLETNTAVKCQSVEMDSQETLAPTNALEQPPQPPLAQHNSD